MGLPLATMATSMYGLCVGRGDTKTPLVVTVFWTYVRLRKLIQKCFIDEQMSSWWRYIHSSFIQIFKIFTCIRRDRAGEGLVCKQSIDLRYSYMFCKLPFLCWHETIFPSHWECLNCGIYHNRANLYQKPCLKGSILIVCNFGWRHGM